MPKTSYRRMALIVGLAIVFSDVAFAQTSLSLEEVLQKNLQASGGRERIDRIQNLAFKIGSSRYITAADGRMKVLTGKDPVIVEAILVGRDSVQKNSLKGLEELTGNQKASYQTLATLYAGVFTLDKFAKELQFQGEKSLGLEKFYLVSAKVGSLTVDFFLRADDFLLKRMVFHGVTPDGDKYEVNYDFGPFEQVEGCLVPLSWFSSQVGTRGNLSDLTEVKVNVPLGNDFFAKPDLNAGTVAAAPGALRGTILDFNSLPNGLIILTNWTKRDADEAGLKTNDRLVLTVEGIESELVFYATANDLPPQAALAQGARLLAPSPRGGETYLIQFLASDTSQIVPKLKILGPIEITKKK